MRLTRDESCLFKLEELLQKDRRNLHLLITSVHTTLHTLIDTLYRSKENFALPIDR